MKTPRPISSKREAKTICFLLALLLVIAFQSCQQAKFPTHDSIYSKIEIPAGICVLLGDDMLDLAMHYAQTSDTMIYWVSPSDRERNRAQAKLDAAGLLGKNVYVEQGSSSKIHLASNLADRVITHPEPAFSKAEIMRVLRPGGQWITATDTQTKPEPAGIDQWTHPYHGPDNNPLSQDQLAKAPYLTHFLAKPYYCPMPEVTVTAGGRIFKAFGHIAFKKREWATLSKLAAFNGFNGTQVWERDLTPGFMIHRNTMIATPNTLYLADNESCKLIDAKTGKLHDEIFIPLNEKDLYGWKWMAMADGMLYALLGQPDIIDEVMRGTKTTAGWPWNGLGDNYAKLKNQYPWGFGNLLVAIDLNTKAIQWKHQEPSNIDSRALVMKDKRIYAYSHQNYLVALDTQTGKPIWRQSNEELLQAIGEHDPAQTWQKGFSSQIYLTAGEQALYFAGPQRTKTVAVSMKNGKVLWDYPDGNMLLVSRNNSLYALGKLGPSKKFDPRTGKILADLPFLRGNCTRVTGTVDSLFARGDDHGGTLRVDMAADTPSRFPAMRPACQDGVIAANGLLYWGPWVCDCNHSLIGFIAMAPAGDFDYTQSGTNSNRLESFANMDKQTHPPDILKTDWPTYRKTNQRTSQTSVNVGEKIEPAWEFIPHRGIKRTAPIAVGDYTYVSGEDGIVYALDSRSGALQWTAYTGGEVHYPPCYWAGRLFVGSADGWVYAFAAETGQILWRFRAAPVERKIPVYGKLYSTWPVTSVLVEQGIVYAAAGIVGNDGTHLYALNAENGEILWQNNESGRLFDTNKPTGVSVQGHMLLHGKKLYLAGGNAVSPAIYDIKTGKCLNHVEDEWQKAPRGKELFVINDEVKVFDQMLYAPREYIPSRYYAKYLLHAGTGSDIAYQGTENAMMCIQFNAGEDGKAKALWKQGGFAHTSGVAVTQNAVLTIGGVKNGQHNNQLQNKLTALDRETGEPIFDTPLPAHPASWGMAVDRNGTILVTTDQGHVLGYQTKKMITKK